MENIYEYLQNTACGQGNSKTIDDIIAHVYDGNNCKWLRQQIMEKLDLMMELKIYAVASTNNNGTNHYYVKEPALCI